MIARGLIFYGTHRPSPHMSGNLHKAVITEMQTSPGAWAALQAFQLELQKTARHRGFTSTVRHASWELLRDDRYMIGVAMVCLIIAVFPSLWSPQWLALCLRFVYSNAPVTQHITHTYSRSTFSS